MASDISIILFVPLLFFDTSLASIMASTSEIAAPIKGMILKSIKLDTKYLPIYYYIFLFIKNLQNILIILLKIGLLGNGKHQILVSLLLAN